jgi:hypothetical protein
MIPFYNSAPSKFDRRTLSDVTPPPLSELSSVASPPVPTKKYDSSLLSRLTNVSSELLANAKELADESTQADKDFAEDKNLESQMANAGKDINTKNTGKDNLLAMIFKIVPIGINIAKKGKTIVQGLKETYMGIADIIKNTAILTGIIGMDTILFSIQLCVFIFKLLVCSVEKMSNFPKCIIFYIIDILIMVLLAAFVSILFIMDVILMPKYWAGIGCVEIFILLLNIIEQIDKVIYKLISVHLVHYPEKILNMCYDCAPMRDISGFKQAASKWFNDVFIRIPKDIGGPIGGTLTGIGHIFSFFNLSS